MPFTETMTPKQRTMAALNRLPVDRAPVANPTNVANSGVDGSGGRSLPAGLSGPGVGGSAGRHGLTPNWASTPSCLTSASSRSRRRWAARCNGRTRTTGLPSECTGPSGKTADDVHIPPGILEHRDMLAITGAIRQLKGEFGNEVAIIGKTMGALDAGLSRLRRGAFPFGHGGTTPAKPCAPCTS